MGQRENSRGGGQGGGSTVLRRRLQTTAASSRRHSRHVWPTASSSKCLALALFVLSAAACSFSPTSASVLPSSLATSRGGGSAQQLPEWSLEVVADGETLTGVAPPHSAPVDVDELATWFSPSVVEDARKTVVGVSPVGRGLDIDAPAGPAAGSGGILVDSSALLAGSRGESLNGALAAAVPAGTRFVLTSRRAVSSGFANYEVTLADGRKAAAKLVYVDAFYPVAVLVVVAESGEATTTAATAAATRGAAAAGATPLCVRKSLAVSRPPPDRRDNSTCS